ncbi:uncharacterized protein LOC133332685 [Musca vetustissima]|uniref:uncharacterized protein LOC133332685 n=1 Tax=Musca vetustissima TaxID=27455 RepID=UPI002AB61CDB|nr:uncharacterized protein LOC133332685 [Musca vetustissima]
MEEEPVYSLLQAIDPTKIKVPINERFSKLTLSSNKKKQNRDLEEEEYNNANCDEAAAVPSEKLNDKRRSASRNLLQQLSQQQQSQDSEMECRNPLLLTDSSKDQSDERNNMTHLREQYETMDPLNVTEDQEEDDKEEGEDLHSNAESIELPAHLDVAVDELSHKISTIDLLSRPISISSSCSSSGVVETPDDVTQLVSTESQRSSMGIEPRLNIIELPITKVFKKEVIGVVPTTTIEHRETSKQYEMTEDEDEEDTEDDVITISDSSVSGETKAEEPSNMAMTTINTIKGNLAGLSPDKMERMAAFLKDVSIEQRNLQENGGNITLDNLDYRETSSSSGESEKEVKARRIATADTESVTPYDDEYEEDIQTKSLKERQERIKTFAGDSSEENNNNSLQNEENERDIHRLAYDETQDNSIMTDLQVSPSQQYKYEDKTPQNKAKIIANAETQENTSHIYSSPDENTSDNDNDCNTPKPPHHNDKSSRQARRLVSAETEENTIMTEEIAEPIYKTPIKSTIQRNYALDETESNTQLNCSDTSCDKDKAALRLAHNETEVNTEISTQSSPTPDYRNMAEDETQANTSHSDANSTPRNKITHKNIAQADTEEVNDSIYIASSPEMKTPQKSCDNSINSCISESPAADKSAPDHSITILETDEEEIENSRTSSTSPQSNDNNKLSTSLRNTEHSEIYGESDDDDSSHDGQMSQIQMSMANINISAKINIKIQVTDSTEPSEDGDYSDNRRSTIDSLPEQQQKLSQ